MDGIGQPGAPLNTMNSQLGVEKAMSHERKGCFVSVRASNVAHV